MCIRDRYGGYIFDNPFAKVMRLWGAEDFSKLVYKAKKIYDAHRHDLEKERTEDEFMAMYEQYEAFDDLEEEYLDIDVYKRQCKCDASSFNCFHKFPSFGRFHSKYCIITPFSIIQCI